jgi:RimJ/RimL family protein N-acetyltransferase
LIQLREAFEKDYQEICDLIKSETDLFMVYPAGTFPLDVDQLHGLSKERKDLTVIVNNSEVIGFANFYNYVATESAFVGNIVVKNGLRGKGLGRKIVSHMLNLAFNKHRLQEVHLSVFSHNTKALFLYSSFGFRPYGIEERRDRVNKRAALLHMKLSRANYEAGE